MIRVVALVSPAGKEWMRPKKNEEPPIGFLSQVVVMTGRNTKERRE